MNIIKDLDDNINEKNAMQCVLHILTCLTKRMEQYDIE